MEDLLPEQLLREKLHHPVLLNKERSGRNYKGHLHLQSPFEPLICVQKVLHGVTWSEHLPGEPMHFAPLIQVAFDGQDIVWPLAFLQTAVLDGLEIGPVPPGLHKPTHGSWPPLTCAPGPHLTTTSLVHPCMITKSNPRKMFVRYTFTPL
jgi:hypothetical protein